MSKLQIRFKQIDPSAKKDILSIAANAKKAWSVIDDLKKDEIPTPGNYASMEHNYTILNGEMDEFPDDTSGKVWGWWSSSYSDANGNFVSPPTLDISFAENHKSKGLTFYFYPHTDDYARTVRVTWYNSAGGIIKTGTYTLDSVISIVIEPVMNFRKIKIEMLSTNIRYRYIKLFALDYGIIRYLQDGEIDSCSIYEEIDPTVESISINTLNARIRTRTPFFNPVSGDLSDDMMMKKQIMTVMCGNVPFGTFFLEEWEDVGQSGIVFDFSAGDAISILDLYLFTGGMYTNKLVSELLTEIFAVVFPTGLIKFVLDPAFTASRVTGWLPMDTCGAAFQNIMFAIHAIADTSRIGNVWIYPRETSVEYDIDLDSQYLRGSIKPTEYCSGVDVVSHNYTPGAESIEVYNDILPSGQHTIEFSEPLHSLSITGGTIVSSNANYATVNVTTQRTVVLSGSKYIDNKLIHSVRSELDAGEVANVKRYEDYTLVSPSTGKQLAEKLFIYLQNRLKLEGDIILNDKEVGYIARTRTKGLDVKGAITSLDINLRANKARMVVVGNVD